jgi:hypothetical protein
VPPSSPVLIRPDVAIHELTFNSLPAAPVSSQWLGKGNRKSLELNEVFAGVDFAPATIRGAIRPPAS